MANGLIKGSEEYAQYMATLEREWHKEYDEIFEKMIKTLDEALACHDKTSLDELAVVFMDENIVSKLRRRSIIPQLCNIFTLYKKERAANCSVTVMDYCDSVEGLIQFIREIRFALWKIEFMGDIDLVNPLTVFFRDNEMSSFFIDYCIELSCVDKERIRKLIRSATDEQ